MSDQTTIQISATTIAWYGAIVATVSVFIHSLNYLRDRSKIKIEYKGDIKVVGHQSIYDPNKIYFNIRVINKGRRTINIAKVFIVNIGINKPYHLLTDSGRKTVLSEENPSADFLAEQSMVDFSKCYYIAIYDATGKIYKKYFHKFPTFWRFFYWLKNYK